MGVNNLDDSTLLANSPEDAKMLVRAAKSLVNSSFVFSLLPFQILYKFSKNLYRSYHKLHTRKNGRMSQMEADLSALMRFQVQIRKYHYSGVSRPHHLALAGLCRGHLNIQRKLRTDVLEEAERGPFLLQHQKRRRIVFSVTT